MKARPALRRVHIWLGWLVGVPILLWTVSGTFMAFTPIETIRGEALLRDLPALPSGVVAPPQMGPRPVESLTLQQRVAGPRWIIRYAGGGARMADPATGRLLPGLTAAEATQEIRARYTGTARIVAVDRTSADDPPLDYRRAIAAWRVTMSDGTHFYVDPATGDVVRRTKLWRIYDFMWGLHIMDLQTREETSHGWLIVFGGLSAVTALLALALLPMASRRKRRRG